MNKNIDINSKLNAFSFINFLKEHISYKKGPAISNYENGSTIHRSYI